MCNAVQEQTGSLKCTKRINRILVILYDIFLRLPPKGYIFVQTPNVVLILDGSLKHAAHTWRKIGLLGKKKSGFDCSRFIQMPETDQMTDLVSTLELPSHMRTKH